MNRLCQPGHASLHREELCIKEDDKAHPYLPISFELHIAHLLESHRMKSACKIFFMVRTWYDSDFNCVYEQGFFHAIPVLTVC